MAGAPIWTATRPRPTTATDILDLRVGTSFVDWGTYNAAHTYAASFVGAGAVANFNIFDGDVNTDTQNESWFGDNSGTLALNISKGFSGVTGENGCTTFSNVPYGTYTAGEVAQEGWSYVSGAGEVSIDQSEETITIVNHDESDEGGGDEGGDDESALTFATTTVHAEDLADNLGEVGTAPTSWFFYNDETDTIDSSLGSFVAGPDTAPLGDGSAQMSVNGTQRRNIATYQFKDVKLADIDRLEFATYSQSAGNGSPSSERSAYLNFNVDFDNSDTWQRRLVYLPSVNGTIVNDSWQSWDAIDGGSALWLYSGSTWPAGIGEPGTTPGTTAKTWTQILSTYPNAETRSSDSWFGFRVGEPYADGFTGNVDKFVIATSSGLTGHTTTYDFEPTAPQIETVTTTDSEDSEDGDGGGGGQFVGVPTFFGEGEGEVLGAETGPSSFGECSALLKTYMRLGGANDVVEVMLLQNFLNIEMNSMLAVSGIFDLPTDTAVRAFQAKYADEILAPWGLSAPTGYVYTLTLWKINEIMCPGLAAKPGVVPGGPGGQGGMGDATVAPGAQGGIAAGVVLGEENATSSATSSAATAKNSAAAALGFINAALPGWFWLLVLALILLGYSSYRAYKKYGNQA